MRKFLSILMLACLLCGLALPVGAEGEPAQLYVKVGTAYHDSLSIPEGFSKTVAFYTKNEETNEYVPLSTGTPFTENTAVSLSGNVDNCIIEANSVVESADITVNDESVTYAPVRVTITASQLQIKKTTETTWGASLSGIKAGESVPVEFRLTADGESVPYTDAITVNPTDGLTYSSGTLTATKAGTYTLSCNYSGTVTVTATAAVLSADDLNTSELLNGVLQSKATLEAYLSGKGYPTSGDITLQLPESVAYDDTITIGQGMDGVTLTLQGNKNTFKKGLVVKGGNNTIDGISFSSGPAITLENVAQCAVSNCSFDSKPFKIQTELLENGKIRAPKLILSGNIYTSAAFADVVDSTGKELCTWLAQTKPEPTSATIMQLGVNVEKHSYGSEIQAHSFIVDDSVNNFLDNGWSFELSLPCNFDSAYTTCHGEEGTGLFEPNTNPKRYRVKVTEGGLYAVISGSYPKLEKGNVVLRQVDADFLWTVTVDTTLSGATVTYNSKQVPAWINNKKLSFYPNGAGTYKVASATTTVTKASATPTTRRSYNYKYQDYYLITPQRVTDCMRYAKDNLVTIECKEAGRRSISLPVASMAAAAEKGYSILLKNEKIANITMDPAALKSMAQ